MKKIPMLIALIAISLFFAGTLKADTTPHVIEVPNGKIEYYRLGHGTPLILIAGYFANVKSWNKSFLNALAREHDVIVFDNRNVGGSFNSSKKYTSQALAEDTYRLTQALHLSHVDVLGISMGGMIAQQFAINYPKTVDHLILVNTFIAGIPPTLPDQQIKDDLYNPPKNKLKQYLMVLRVLFPPEARFKMFFSFLHDRFNPSYKETPFSPVVMKQQQALVFGWIKNKDALQKIRQLKIPVLILSGGSDYVIPYQNTDLLHKEIPHSKLVRWEDGGHAMMFQYPEPIAKVINDWLEPK